MRLLDSNVVIYATQPAYLWLRTEILSQPFSLSYATRVEVLGWHQITPETERDLLTFMIGGRLLSITDDVADKAVELRQKKKMSLGDAFVAATALRHGLELVTRNTADFKHIAGLRLFDPFDTRPA